MATSAHRHTSSRTSWKALCTCCGACSISAVVNGLLHMALGAAEVAVDTPLWLPQFGVSMLTNDLVQRWAAVMAQQHNQQQRQHQPWQQL